MKKDEYIRPTVGDFIRELRMYPEDCEIMIGPDEDGNEIQFYRLKKRDEKLLQIELSPHSEVE
ncbi:MAG: hypothetical protein ACOVLI_01300 [Rhabdaerophilum sp.]